MNNEMKNKMCDNNCITDNFSLIYACSQCKKRICRQCLGLQTGHHFIIHNYCKKCIQVSI